MTGALFLRRLLRPPSSAAAAAVLNKTCFLTTAATAVKEQNCKNSPEKRNDEKWLTLPPYKSTVDGGSLGRIISRGGRVIIEEEEKEGGETTSFSALKWILRCCPQLPRSLVHKLFRLRQVRRECSEGAVDNDGNARESWLKRVGEKELMNEGDRIYLPLSVQGSHVRKKREYKFNDEEKHFTRSLVLYKDSSIIVINKPPKLPVQGGIGIKKSVDELAAAYLRYDYDDPPRLVHRLDQDTSGILVLGRTQTSAPVLHSIFREKTAGALDDMEIAWKKRYLNKRYLALVFGVPRQLNGVVTAPLGKVLVDDGKSERITVVDRNSPSQHAVTEYTVIQTSDYGYTWLELSPITGRKHQLRVHCAEVLGTPIVGDYKYGWQAHRRWKPIQFTTNSSELQEPKPNNLRHLDSDCGSIAEKQPHLHLHCKQLILPNISLALENASPESNYDFSKLDNLNLVAPLPFHMQRSWNLLNNLSHHQCSRDSSERGDEERSQE